MSDDLLIDLPTGLHTRERLMSDLSDAIGRERGTTLLVLFSLQGASTYGEREGPARRDELLVRLSHRLTTALDGAARCYRTREVELAALIDAPIATAMALLTDAVTALEDEALEDEGESESERVGLTSSFGAAILPDEAEDSIAALMLADERLFLNSGSRMERRYFASRR